MIFSTMGSNISLLSFLMALIFSVMIVATVKWHGRFTLDGTNGVQKQHSTPIPRVGGAAILGSFILSYFFAADSVKALLGPVLVAALPAFSFGFIEDLTKRVSVRTRLLATMASGVTGWALMGVSIKSVNLWGLDAALAWMPFSILFTAFAVGGVANAVNIIDGFNGLASGTVAICIFTLGVIALNVGDTDLSTMCFLISAATVGFLFVNFPFGKLFMGDGGAYMLGFIMAWIGIMLPARNPSVSVWASLLACGYPVFETVFTIARRLWTRSHPGLADSAHLHSLVKVAISDRLFGGISPQFANAFVSPFCWLIAAFAAVLSVNAFGNTRELMVSTLLSFMLYIAAYGCVRVGAKYSKRRPARSHLTVVRTVKNESFAVGEIDTADDDMARTRVG